MGAALHLIWPSFIKEEREETNKYQWFRILSALLQVVLAHPPMSLSVLGSVS
jgi:hypothetical protein